jgi:SPP1 gp7 family putative phage head morphogenesis protein
LKVLRTNYTGEFWPSDLTELANLFIAELPLEQYQFASRLIASHGARKFIEAAGIEPGLLIPSAAPVPLSKWPAEYQKAAEWLRERGILSIEEARALAESIAPVTDVRHEAVLREIRQENLALAGSQNAIMTERIRNMLTDAVETGKTFVDFIETLDEMMREGQIPEWSRAYAETVYRTELANAYGAQRDWLDGLPIIASHTWGYEFFNPNDERSNASHAAMDGVIVQYGSPSDIASRPGPPWFYNCRCDRLPILVPDPISETGYVETPDALERVQAILRFPG